MRRVRLTFISEFDWTADEFTPDHMDELVGLFMEDPFEFTVPTDDDEQTFISVQDITDEED